MAKTANLDYFWAGIFLKPIFDMTPSNRACNGQTRWWSVGYVRLVVLRAAFLATGFLVAAFFATVFFEAAFFALVFFVAGFFAAAFRVAGSDSMAWFLGESALAAPFGGVVVSNS